MPTSETITSTVDEQDAPRTQVVPGDDAPLYCLTMSRSVAQRALVVTAVLTLLAGWIASAVLGDADTTVGGALPMILATLLLAGATAAAWKNLAWLKQDPAPEGKVVLVPAPAPRRKARPEPAAVEETPDAPPAGEAPSAEDAGMPAKPARRGRFRKRRPESSVTAPEAVDPTSVIATPVAPTVVAASIVAPTVVAPTVVASATAPTEAPEPALDPASSTAPDEQTTEPTPPAGLPIEPAVVAVLPTTDSEPDPKPEPEPAETGVEELPEPVLAPDPTAFAHPSLAPDLAPEIVAPEIVAPEIVAPTETEPAALDESDDAGNAGDPDWFAPARPSSGHGMGPAPAGTVHPSEVSDATLHDDIAEAESARTATEPAASEPTPATEPAATEPTPATEPAASEPAASEPAASEPAASEPTPEPAPAPAPLKRRTVNLQPTGRPKRPAGTRSRS